MPIYEFYCPQNNTLYQFLARSLAHRGAVPLCPDNPEFKLEKRVSHFAVIGKAKEESEDDPFAGMDEAKMESLMSEMETEMGALDSENPDPRQLGHLMRKLTDVMGDKTPPELREVIRRLESGEDPEKLEEEFGGFDEGNAAASDPFFSQMKKIIRGARQPIRDPRLYDLRDWLKAE
jgi:exonuclease VII small subunit